MLDYLIKTTVGVLALLIASYALLHVAGFLTIPLLIAWLLWWAFK